MKLSNEARIAVLAIVAIGILIWGYNFLQGQNVFKKTINIYAVYDNVNGLQKSDPVRINGFKVGTVGDIYLKEDYSGKIMVRIDLKKNLQVPKDETYAAVASDIMGSTSVALEFKGKCSEPNCLETGDTIKGTTQSMFDDITDEIDPYIKWAQSSFGAIDSILTVYTSDKNNEVYQSINDFRGILDNLNGVSKKLDLLLAKSASDIDATLNNVKTLSETLKNNASQIDKIVANSLEVSEDLKKLELNQTVTNANGAIADLQKTVETINQTAVEITAVIEKVNNKEGSLGLLVNERDLYDNLNDLTYKLQVLSDDIRVNPKRYINIRRKVKEEPLHTPAPKKTN